ncbi:MAG: ATP-binding cassette domain-containing protein [Rikenellaceae bacterium]
MQKIIDIKDGVTRQKQYKFRKNIDFSVVDGEQIAVVGSNGAGKSILMGIVTGLYPLYRNEVVYDFSPSLSTSAFENIKYLTFRDSYGADTDSGYYYQQRWNSQDRELSPIVGDLLISDNLELKDELFSLFNLQPLLDKQLVLLSSGELRKFQITKVLLSNPRVVIMDNPFIGLDERSRKLLENILERLSKKNNLQLILVFSKTNDIPQFITDVVEIDDMVCGEKISLTEYSCHPKKFKNILSDKKKNMILSMPYSQNQSESDSVIEFRNITIKYDERTILKNLNWSVMRGEKWALSGDNGSGKSTLLSLVCADNPQSYACDISLFGRKRGSGESIWDIKRKIGYVSPEMHRSFQTSHNALSIVASGLYDTTGLYENLDEEQIGKSIFWMQIFDIQHLRDKNFMLLSSGEQRLVLLARAFVKDPELLVLDEPLHGLDLRNRALALEVIEAFSARRNKTLIVVTHYKNELPSVITNSIYLDKNN